MACSKILDLYLATGDSDLIGSPVAETKQHAVSHTVPYKSQSQWSQDQHKYNRKTVDCGHMVRDSTKLNAKELRVRIPDMFRRWRFPITNGVKTVKVKNMWNEENEPEDWEQQLPGIPFGDPNKTLHGKKKMDVDQMREVYLYLMNKLQSRGTLTDQVKYFIFMRDADIHLMNNNNASKQEKNIQALETSKDQVQSYDTVTLSDLNIQQMNNTIEPRNFQTWETPKDQVQSYFPVTLSDLNIQKSNNTVECRNFQSPAPIPTVVLEKARNEGWIDPDEPPIKKRKLVQVYTAEDEIPHPLVESASRNLPDVPSGITVMQDNPCSLMTVDPMSDDDQSLDTELDTSMNYYQSPLETDILAEENVTEDETMTTSASVCTHFNNTMLTTALDPMMSSTVTWTPTPHNPLIRALPEPDVTIRQKERSDDTQQLDDWWDGFPNLLSPGLSPGSSLNLLEAEEVENIFRGLQAQAHDATQTAQAQANNTTLTAQVQEDEQYQDTHGHSTDNVEG